MIRIRRCCTDQRNRDYRTRNSDIDDAAVGVLSSNCLEHVQQALKGYPAAKNEDGHETKRV
jgi:hypothetical protein